MSPAHVDDWMPLVTCQQAVRRRGGDAGPDTQLERRKYDLSSQGTLVGEGASCAPIMLSRLHENVELVAL